MSDIQSAFKSSLPGLNYVFKNGDVAQFIVRDGSGIGMYYTDDQDKIDELTTEVNRRNPYIYIDENEKTVDVTALTPMARLKKQLRNEIMQELANKTNPANNLGVYENVTTAARSVVTSRSATGQDLTEDERREILLADTRAQQAALQQMTGVGQVATPDNGASAVFTDDQVVVNLGAGGTQVLDTPDVVATAEQIAGTGPETQEPRQELVGTTPVTAGGETSTSGGEGAKLSINLNKQLGAGASK